MKKTKNKILDRGQAGNMMKPRTQVKALAWIGSFMVLIIILMVEPPYFRESEILFWISSILWFVFAFCMTIEIDIVFNEIDKARKA